MRFSHASEEVIEGNRPRSCLNFRARFASSRASSTVRATRFAEIAPEKKKLKKRTFRGIGLFWRWHYSCN